MAGPIPELQQLIDKLNNFSAAYSMEVSLEKSKIMVHEFSNSHAKVITIVIYTIIYER